MTKKCVLLKHGLLIKNNSTVGVCCFNQTHPSKYTSYDIDKVGCNTCIVQEENGIKSYRQGVNEEYGLEFDHQHPILIDVVPNNNCNLTCKICNPSSSSSWAKLEQIKIRKNYNMSVSNFKSTLDKFDLSYVKEINFSGGEPLLNDNISKYVGVLEDKIDFSKCKLRFSTNGTYQLTSKISEFFLRFRLVLARFSIDDIDAGFEYQRYPAKWAVCETNWKHFLDTMPHNVIPSINRTVSVLNIRRLHLLDQWHSDFAQTRFEDPIELIDHFAHGNYSLRYIPSDLVEHIKQSGHSRAWNYLKNFKTTADNRVLKNTILRHDKLHNTNLEEFDPILYRTIFQ
jgi:hypothetical protein